MELVALQFAKDHQHTSLLSFFAGKNTRNNDGLPPVLIAPKQNLASQQLRIEGEKLSDNILARLHSFPLL